MTNAAQATMNFMIMISPREFGARPARRKRRRDDICLARHAL
jgi:hypothetical protein